MQPQYPNMQTPTFFVPQRPRPGTGNPNWLPSVVKSESPEFTMLKAKLKQRRNLSAFKRPLNQAKVPNAYLNANSANMPK